MLGLLESEHVHTEVDFPYQVSRPISLLPLPQRKECRNINGSSKLGSVVSDRADELTCRVGLIDDGDCFPLGGHPWLSVLGALQSLAIYPTFHSCNTVMGPR